MDRYIGTLLDNRYEILELIGSGGMAMVYKARCNRLNRLVAIKILKEELFQDEEFRRRFHAESQAVAMLSHPNIVSVYDVSHSDNIDYIVMELIEGITLKQYMEQKGQLSWREALHFATQIAKALEHAHSRGIIHRDIKPHNIMILKDGSVKVADFGIAQISSAQNTLTREALGSVHYISPEQAKGAHVDARSDLYSLGVVMYEMLAGRPPFDGDTPVSVAIQHINATPVALHTLCPSVPAGLEKIVMRAMEADLDARYPSAAAMLADMEEFRKNPNWSPGEPVVSRAAESDAQRLSDKILERSAAERAVARAGGRTGLPPEQTRREKKRTRVAMVAGTVCIVLAFIAIGVFLYQFFLSDLFTRTAEDTVPRLVGQVYDEIDASQYPNFTIEVKAWRSSDQYAYGYVMDQTPDAGRSAKVGTKIELTVSSGAESNLMPNLVNKSLQEAQAELNALPVSVVVNVTYQLSDVYTDGYVIETMPASGAALTEGQTVTLAVSQGSAAALVPVPPLVGLDIDQALALIDESGLGRGSVLTVDDDAPEGTVTFQSIAADEQVKAGTVINLQVSRGPKNAAAPEITRQSGDQTAFAGDSFSLFVEASAADDGTLTYAWYRSKTGSTDDGELLVRSGDNAQISVTEDTAGTYYYYCKVVNTLDDSKAYTLSDMICVIVEPGSTVYSQVIEVEGPDDDEKHSVEVYLDGEMALDPFTVDMSEVPDGIIRIAVEGVGTQQVQVYIDNRLALSKTIRFG